MIKKVARESYKNDLSDEFLSDAKRDLKQGLTTYVYKEHILNKLKDVFNDLDIKRNDFYWTVKVNK
jgi:hypothetical protein